LVKKSPPVGTGPSGHARAGPGRRELPAGHGRQVLQTTVHPETMKWIRAVAERRECGLGRVIDDLIARAIAIADIVNIGELLKPADPVPKDPVDG
jgi:hypothetical protein